MLARFSVSGIRPHGCALVEPARCLTEEYGVVVGHMLVDASSGSGRVLIVNPNVEIVVLPGLTLISKFVPISVAMEDTRLPNDGPAALPEYLEEIVRGSHPSLGHARRQRLRDLIFRYRHVFPAPGEPVTGRTTTVQHDIIMTDARPVRCGPRRLAPAGLRKEQTCVKEMLDGGQIEPSDSPWASPVVLVTKKDRKMRCCVDYPRLNALTTKDAYPLPRIDDSLRLLGNQQWFSTMDLASGYWQVAMSPEAKRKPDIPHAPDVPPVGALCPPSQDSSSDVIPAVGYARLPLPSINNNVMPELVWVPALPQPKGRAADREVPVPRWRLAYHVSDYAEPTGDYGLLLSHPRFVEWIGVSQSAGLLELSGGQWVDKLSREQAVTAAVHQQRDVRLMQTNVDVLDQYVLSLQKAASRIIDHCLGPYKYPAAEIAMGAL